MRLCDYPLIRAMKPNLLFLPGFMLNEHLWDMVYPDLSRCGALYFGDLSQDDTIDAMAERVLQSAPPSFYLFGFSMGGFVAQAIALKAPERVLGLGLLNTSCRPQSTQESSATLTQIALAEKTPFKGLTSRALASAVHPDRAKDTALIGRLQQMALDNGKAVFLRQLAALRDARDANLEAIQCPVLIMRTVQESQEMAQRIPHAEMHIIPQCGHMTPLETPAAFVDIITTWVQQQS
jgi:pimeloyl-ACP methyl ester carboxylesterase